MAKQNSIGNATGSLTVDPGAAGDSSLQFSISGTPEFVIGVYDTDDSFRISQGNTPAVNDCLIVESTGVQRRPLNPLFAAFRETTLSNVTGSNNTYNISMDGESYDIGGHYSGVTFVAPVTGIYLVVGNIQLQELTTTHQGSFFALLTSNRNFRGNTYNTTINKPAGTMRLVGSCLVDMDAGDNLRSNIRTFGAGTNTVDVYGEATNYYTSISGYLMC